MLLKNSFMLFGLVDLEEEICIYCNVLYEILKVYFKVDGVDM